MARQVEVHRAPERVGEAEIVRIEVLVLQPDIEGVGDRDAQRGDTLPCPGVVPLRIVDEALRENRNRGDFGSQPGPPGTGTDREADPVITAEIQHGVGHHAGQTHLAARVEQAGQERTAGLRGHADRADADRIGVELLVGTLDFGPDRTEIIAELAGGFPASLKLQRGAIDAAELDIGFIGEHRAGIQADIGFAVASHGRDGDGRSRHSQAQYHLSHVKLPFEPAALP